MLVDGSTTCAQSDKICSLLNNQRRTMLAGWANPPEWLLE